MSRKNLPTFLLDTNVFIQAHRSYYAMDICPGFWECLIHHYKNGRLLSIDSVRSEMIDKERDPLEKWVKKIAPKDMFVSTNDLKVGNAYQKVINWLNGRGYSDRVIRDFSAGADGWLVAYAMAYDGVELVTTEVHSIQAKNRIPIPNICEQFNVDYLNSFSMLKKLEVKFHWETMKIKQ